MLKDSVKHKQMAESDLRNFLTEHRVNAGEVATLTTKGTGQLGNGQGWPSGSYYIPKESTQAFWIYYCNAIKRSTASDTPSIFTITEIPHPFGPLRVDFDFKSSLNGGGQRRYTLDMLKSIVGFYQQEIKEIIHPDHFEDRHLWCIVLEKPAPRVDESNEYFKDGFHLHFPHFICTEYVQESVLRSAVTKAMQDSGIWEDSGIITPVNKIIDEKMFKKPWMLYGSMNYKGKNSLPYLYNRWPTSKNPYGHAFNHNLDEMSMDVMFAREVKGRKNTSSGAVRYYLPEFLSVRGWKDHVPFTKEIDEKSVRQTRVRSRFIPAKRDVVVVIAELKLIRETFMDMLSDDRSDGKQEWLEVGRTLFGIGQGMEQALEIWIEFSKRSAKFVEGECEELWQKFEMNERTIGSIKKWASVDSPEKYKLWKNTGVRNAMFDSLKETVPKEYDLSKVVDELRHDKYICADPKRSLWYEFTGHRYREMPDEVSLKKFLVEDVIALYADLKEELSIKSANVNRKLDALKDAGSENEEELKKSFGLIETQIKRCTAVISKLKDINFLEKVIKMCKLHMNKPDFFKKRDENRLIFGCENGVLDLSTCTFREGSPDDYRTFTTELEYRTFREDDDEVKEYRAYLEKVYPNPNLRNYFSDVYATCLEGGNQHKRVLFMIGGPDGAKSMTTNMIEMAFGSGELGYFGKFPRELLVQATGKTSSAGCRPELARVRGKRIMSCQEVTKKERFNVGFVKEASGNDSFFARNVYEKGTDIKPQHTLIAQMNSFPQADDDDAFWSRTRCLDHESTFVKTQDLEKNPVPATHEEQMKQKKFYADANYSQRLPTLAQVMLWDSFERYKVYKKNGCVLNEPKDVMQSTNARKALQDKYLRFYQMRIERVKNEAKALKSSITYQTLISEFEAFRALEYPNDREKIGRTDFMTIMSKYMGVIKNKEKDFYGLSTTGSKFYGYTWKKIEEDENEDTDTAPHQVASPSSKSTAPTKGKATEINDLASPRKAKT